MAVLLETSLGDLVIDLECKLAPRACENFLRLCKLGYYDGVLFHSVQKGFVLQTGDPLADGSGGQCYSSVLGQSSSKYFPVEKTPRLKHNDFGVVAMNTTDGVHNGSQFYIQCTEEPLTRLDGKNTVFGKVSEGLDTVEAIGDTHADGDCRPLRNIEITRTLVIDDPFESEEPRWFKDALAKVPRLPVSDLKHESSKKSSTVDSSNKSGDGRIEAVEMKSAYSPLHFAKLSLESDGLSPESVAQKLETVKSRIELRRVTESDVEQLAAKSESQLFEELKKRSARTDALALQILRDIPDSDMKPPSDVLFVCKLNPLTDSDSLELIFSQFGRVADCQVIRDWKTQDSLCYAFVGFDKRADCERAYVEMNNCLIDDRRIRVDFSQSVAKYWAHFKGGGKFSKENTRKINAELESTAKKRDSKSSRRSGSRERRGGDYRAYAERSSHREDGRVGVGKRKREFERREDYRSDERRKKRYRSGRKTHSRSPSPRRSESPPRGRGSDQREGKSRRRRVEMPTEGFLAVPREVAHRMDTSEWIVPRSSASDSSADGSPAKRDHRADRMFRREDSGDCRSHRGHSSSGRRRDGRREHFGDRRRERSRERSDARRRSEYKSFDRNGDRNHDGNDRYQKDRRSHHSGHRSSDRRRHGRHSRSRSRS